jgi:hypothetical protein
MEKKMSCEFTERALENCYEKACEKAYAFFLEADWDGQAFEAWVNWKTDELLSELPDGPC